LHNPRLVNQETDSSDDSSCEDDEDCSLDSGEEVDEEDFYSYTDSDDDEEDGDDEEDEGNNNKEAEEDEDYLKTLTNIGLQEILRNRGLKVSGRKSELIDRLMGREDKGRRYDGVDGDETEEGLKKLTNDQLRERLRNKGLPIGGIKSVLIDRLMGRELPKVKKWEKSKAKSLLTVMFADASSRVHSLTFEEIHASHPQFKAYPFNKFKKYAKTIKEASDMLRKVNRDIEQEVWSDIIRNPRPEMTSRGYPFWDTHPARALLDKDVKDGKADSMKPKKLQQTKAAYKAFPLVVFGGHVQQSKRFVREEPGWVDRRNKEAQKMHVAEVNKMKEDWDAEYVEKDVEYICKKLEDVYREESL